MKEYDLISIGTGSVMNIVDAIIQENSKIKIAVIDKDEPGCICLTRGCIPSKILLYPAELVRTIVKAQEFGIEIDIRKISFERVMERMRTLIQADIEMTRQVLSHSENIDYYHAAAEFVAPYKVKVNDITMKSKMIFLCTGSKPILPELDGIKSYLTSDTVLKLKHLPESIAIIGGGFRTTEKG